MKLNVKVKGLESKKEKEVVLPLTIGEVEKLVNELGESKLSNIVVVETEENELVYREELLEVVNKVLSSVGSEEDFVYLDRLSNLYGLDKIEKKLEYVLSFYKESVEKVVVADYSEVFRTEQGLLGCDLMHNAIQSGVVNGVALEDLIDIDVYHKIGEKYLDKKGMFGFYVSNEVYVYSKKSIEL